MLDLSLVGWGCAPDEFILQWAMACNGSADEDYRLRLIWSKNVISSKHAER
jgi:hypothetical protein